MGNGFKNDQFVLTAQQQARDSYDQARKDYANAFNERIGNINRGDNFNPWLALKMATAEQIGLKPYERDMPELGNRSDQRSSDFDKYQQDAEKAYLDKKRVKTYFPPY
jgi:hypothetical protein